MSIILFTCCPVICTSHRSLGYSQFLSFSIVHACALFMRTGIIQLLVYYRVHCIQGMPDSKKYPLFEEWTFFTINNRSITFGGVCKCKLLFLFLWVLKGPTVTPHSLSTICLIKKIFLNRYTHRGTVIIRTFSGSWGPGVSRIIKQCDPRSYIMENKCQSTVMYGFSFTFPTSPYIVYTLDFIAHQYLSFF